MQSTRVNWKSRIWQIHRSIVRWKCVREPLILVVSIPCTPENRRVGRRIPQCTAYSEDVLVFILHSRREGQEHLGFSVSRPIAAAGDAVVVVVRNGRWWRDVQVVCCRGVAQSWGSPVFDSVLRVLFFLSNLWIFFAAVNDVCLFFRTWFCVVWVYNSTGNISSCFFLFWGG